MKFIFTRKTYYVACYIIRLLKISIIDVLLQIVCSQEFLNVSCMEYLMYSCMVCQFNVQSIVEKPRMYLPGTLELLTFKYKLLVFMGHTLAEKEPSQIFEIQMSRFLNLYTTDCFCLQHLKLIKGSLQKHDAVLVYNYLWQPWSSKSSTIPTMAIELSNIPILCLLRQ